MQILLKFKLYPFKMNFELKSSQVQQLVRTMGLFFFSIWNRELRSFQLSRPLSSPSEPVQFGLVQKWLLAGSAQRRFAFRYEGLLGVWDLEGLYFWHWRRGFCLFVCFIVLENIMFIQYININ